MEDFACLQREFWDFWSNPNWKTSSGEWKFGMTNWDERRFWEPAYFGEPLNNQTERVDAKLKELGFEIGWDAIRDKVVSAFSFQTLSQSQMKTLAEILSYQVQDGRFEFSIRRKASDIALCWLFVQVEYLGLPNLDLFVQSETKEWLKRRVMPNDSQCRQCGKPLIREVSQGAVRNYCHWDDCKTSSRSTFDHQNVNGKHCCWAKRDLLVRTRLCKLKKSKDEAAARSVFGQLLKSLYAHNLANADLLFEIEPKEPNDYNHTPLEILRQLHFDFMRQKA